MGVLEQPFESPGAWYTVLIESCLFPSLSLTRLCQQCAHALQNADGLLGGVAEALAAAGGGAGVLDRGHGARGPIHGIGGGHSDAGQDGGGRGAEAGQLGGGCKGEQQEARRGRCQRIKAKPTSRKERRDS